VGGGVWIELACWQGRERVQGIDVVSLLQYATEDADE